MTTFRQGNTATAAIVRERGSAHRVFQEKAEIVACALGGARRSGAGWLCRCPAHDDHTPSLSLKNGEGEQLLAHCFAGCSQRNIFYELRQRGFLCASTQFVLPVPHTSIPAGPLEWSQKDKNIRRKTIPLQGTVGEKYLIGRGCFVPYCSSLRFLPNDGTHGFPAVVARITDTVTNTPLSLQFILLQPDGKGKASVDRQKILLKGHRKAGGVIRLVDDAEVTTGLGIAEGVETALAAMSTGWNPIWAAVDAGNLANFPVLSGIESLTIFADHDEAGLSASKKCAARWQAAGRNARIVPPHRVGTDWADPVTA